MITETYYCPLSGDQPLKDLQFSEHSQRAMAVVEQWAELHPEEMAVTESVFDGLMEKELAKTIDLEIRPIQPVNDSYSHYSSLMREWQEEFYQQTIRSFHVPAHILYGCDSYRPTKCDRCGAGLPPGKAWFGADVPGSREQAALCIDCFCLVYQVTSTPLPVGV